MCRALCESNPVCVHLWVGSNMEQNTRSEKLGIIVSIGVGIGIGMSIIYGKK